MTSKQTFPLAGSCEGDDGVRRTHGRQFDVRECRDTCFASTLLPHALHAVLYLPPLQAARAASARSALVG